MSKKGKVGPFFYIAGKILNDAVICTEAENYGEFKTWGSHYNFWDSLCKTNFDFGELDVKRQITIGSNDKLIFYDLSFVTTD